MRDNRGRNPLLYAVYAQNERIAKKLILHPLIDLNPINSVGKTPLHIAVLKGLTDIVILLSDFSHLDVNVRDHDS